MHRRPRSIGLKARALCVGEEKLAKNAHATRRPVRMSGRNARVAKVGDRESVVVSCVVGGEIQRSVVIACPKRKLQSRETRASSRKDSLDALSHPRLKRRRVQG